MDGQRCGGFINATSLGVETYIAFDGSQTVTAKGYICPIGQICRVGFCFRSFHLAVMLTKSVKEEKNPNEDITSFDSIFMAALQVVIVASANNVRI